MFRFLLAIGAVLGCALPAAPAAAIEYTYLILEDPSGATLTPAAINDHGEIVGGTSAGPFGFFFDGATFAPLALPGIDSALPADLNDLGDIVGGKVASYQSRGFHWDGALLREFHRSGARSSAVSGVNDAGEMSGNWLASNFSEHGFWIDAAGRLRDLDFPDALHTRLHDVNDSGLVLGEVFFLGGHDAGEGFLYDTQAYQFLSFTVPGVEWTSPRALNDVGQIVGVQITSGGATRRGFVYDKHGFTIIEPPDATGWTLPTGINDQGVVVGTYTSATGNHAFMAIPDLPPDPDDSFPLIPVDPTSPSVSFVPGRVFEMEGQGAGKTVAHDFDGGGIQDLMMGHGVEGARIAVYLGETPDGDPIFNDARSVDVGTFLSDYEIADFDEDGVMDIAVGSYGSQTGSTSVWGSLCGTDSGANRRFPLMRGLGNGSFAFHACLTMRDAYGYTDSNVRAVEVADFDEDGHSDIAVSRSGNYGERAVYLFLGRGDLSFSDAAVLYDSGRPSQMVAVDQNEDGHMDLLVRTSTSGSGPNLLLAGDGTGSFAAQGIGGGWPEALQDLNDDGLDDRVRWVDDKLLIHFGNGVGFNYTPQVLPIPEASSTLFADFNGDCLLDLFNADNNAGENVIGNVRFQEGDGSDHCAPKRACGLLGIEPALLLPWVAARRRSRAKSGNPGRRTKSGGR